MINLDKAERDLSGREFAINILTRAPTDAAIVVGSVHGGGMILHTTAPRGALDLIQIARSVLNTAAELLLMEKSSAATAADRHAALELRLCIEDVLCLLPDPNADDESAA